MSTDFVSFSRFFCIYFTIHHDSVNITFFPYLPPSPCLSGKLFSFPVGWHSYRPLIKHTLKWYSNPSLCLGCSEFLSIFFFRVQNANIHKTVELKLSNTLWEATRKKKETFQMSVPLVLLIYARTQHKQPSGCHHKKATYLSAVSIKPP